MAKFVGGALAVRLVIGLLVFAVPALIIKGVVLDKVGEATKAAGFENVPADPTDVSGDESLYDQGNFAKAVKALEEKAGADPELLKVGVLPYMAEFQVKAGAGAKGYRYYAKNGEIGEFKVKIVGSGSIEGQQFPAGTLRAGITERLESAVREREAGVRVTNMTLERGLVGGRLAWSVNAESDSRSGLVFQAKPDGSGLADPTAFARQGQ